MLVVNLRRMVWAVMGGCFFFFDFSFSGSLSGVPGLYPLVASSIPSAVTTKNTSVVRYPLGAQTTPQLRTVS